MFKNYASVWRLVLFGFSGVILAVSPLIAKSEISDQLTNTSVENSQESNQDDASDFGLGFKLGFSYSWQDHGNLERQLGRFQEGFNLGNGLGGSVSFISRYKKFMMDYEVGGQYREITIFNDSNLVEFYFGYLNVWCRWLVHAPLIGEAVDFMPGAGIGYGFSKLAMRERSKEEDDSTVYSTKLLTGSGLIQFIGVVALIKINRFGGITIDYRYQFAKFKDTSIHNGGEVFFPDDQTMDFSGHTFGIGLGRVW